MYATLDPLLVNRKRVIDDSLEYCIDLLKIRVFAVNDGFIFTRHKLRVIDRC